MTGMSIIRAFVRSGFGPVAALGIVGVLGAFLPARLVAATIPPPAESVAWTQLAPTTSPPERFAAAMTYDATRGNAVLFGGARVASTPPTTFYSDTWTWDGTDWTQRSPI